MNELVHSLPTKKRATRSAAKKPATPAVKTTPTSRTNDPARTMAGILAVATKEFAEKGLSGARIDAIAICPNCHRRAHFGSELPD